MIVKLLKRYFICSIFGHEIASAGSCPYTDKDYAVCIQCSKLMEI